MIKRLNYRDSNFWSDLRSLMKLELESLTDEVSELISFVRKGGDSAVLELTERFDDYKVSNISSLKVPKDSLKSAFDSLPDDFRDALEFAFSRIRSFHEQHVLKDWDHVDELGNILGQRVLPIERVGIYVPGGKASYPSTVLMNAIPAKVAGVKSLTMVSPFPFGEPNPLIMGAAYLCGVDNFYSIGGVQAIAALSYGTESIEAVDKITGPGNNYVAEAKRQVFGKVGVDMIAGSSELLIISDGSSDPERVALDLFAQAEHDQRAQSILVSDNPEFIERVHSSILELLPFQERSEIIEASLFSRGALIEVDNLDQAVEVVNFVSPEHLELLVKNPDSLSKGVTSAGAIFLGEYSSEVLGDYCAGPNHTLPTSRSARFSRPLSVLDFQKVSSVIKISKHAVKELSRNAEILAKAEGLFAHAESASVIRRECK